MRQATTTTASSFWSPFSNQQNDYGIVDDSTCTRTASVKETLLQLVYAKLIISFLLFSFRRAELIDRRQ